MIEKLIKTAMNEVDYTEKNNKFFLYFKVLNHGTKNFTKYAKELDAIDGFYNSKKQGYAWCDVFVDWCFVKTFGVDNAKNLLLQATTVLPEWLLYITKRKSMRPTPRASIPADVVRFLMVMICRLLYRKMAILFLRITADSKVAERQM